MVAEDTEDRYQVKLANAEEAEKFYNHPKAFQSTPVHAYELPDDVAEQADAQKSWSRESVMDRYLKQVRPKTVGIDLPDEEMLEYGIALADEKE